MNEKPRASPPENADADRVIAAGELALGLVLGTDLSRELRADPSLAPDIERWQHDLAGLADALEPVPPRPEVWASIRNAMQSAVPSRLARRSWFGGLLFWRAAAGFGFAAALGLVLLLAAPSRDHGAPPVNRVLLVASILPRDGPPLFTATYDPARQIFIVVPAAFQPEPDRTAQLWLVAKDSDEPIALTVLNNDRVTVVNVSAPQAALVQGDASLVVTDQRAGASGSTAPGPVLAHGRLAAF